ncbi:hypothetical protein VB264_15500 [Arcicella aquatica]|uniref:Fibronectin type 3 domain-containing protein n=1 Tax=Arcicella aquatica TaxID=217141 RepID=A0ABU5QQ54_9BACT|nr:hypothetical protein [Arcicella aquatica]MEA5259201.1 hypothetical protein [Arcicella aquatica]
MKKISLLLLFLGFLCVGNAFAQKANVSQKDTLPVIQKPKIMLLARNYGDSVVLRWSPNMPAYWLMGTVRGYIIERTEYTKDNQQGTRQLLTPKPLKPWTFEQMKNRLAEDEKGIGVVGEMLYGYPNDKKFVADFFNIKKVSQEQNIRFTTTLTAAEFSKKAADAAGLRFVDKSIKKKDALYTYKVYLAETNIQAQSKVQVDTAQAVIEAGQSFLTFAPFVEKPENGDRTTTLIWQRLGPEGDFSAFYIEKSEDGKNFKRVNQTPFVMGKPDPKQLEKDTLLKAQFAKWENKAFYVDSLAKNYHKYYYRIRGIDSFGEESKPSESIVAMGKDLTAPKSPDDFRAKNVNNTSIVLTWKKDIKEPDLKGYVIGRGATVNGPFKPITQHIIPPNALTFTDIEPQAYIGDYYIIASVDTAGNLAYTLPIAGGIEDRLPPSFPTDLVGKADSLGRVTLSWKSPNNPDVASFKIYRSYTPANQYYNQITPVGISRTTFTDTLAIKMLNEHVYYRVVAIDLSNNHSAYSEPLNVKLPDRNPPTTPVIKEVLVTDKGVSLLILVSESEDVVSHIIFRKEGNNEWVSIKEITKEQSILSPLMYEDESVASNKAYQYAVVAKDDDGLLSPKSFPIPVKYFRKTDYQGVSKIDAKVDSEKKQITLSWSPIVNQLFSHYLIYRAINGGGLEMVASSRESNYVDKDYKTENNYQYVIKVAYQDGKFSMLSERITVQK